MTDALVAEYLPVLTGHIKKKYSWVDTRGNCLLTVDDLIQVASIALVKLVEKWDTMLAERDRVREGNGGLFWWYLERDTKRAVENYFKRVVHYDRPDADSFDDHTAGNEEAEDSWAEVRTSLARHRDPSIVQADIADYFTTMPQRDKIILALRYFDDLPWKTVANILGAHVQTTRSLAGVATERWRLHARNQFLEWPEPMPRRYPQPWEPPQTLHDYIAARHRVDLHEYLGWVTICFHEDVGYLTDVLGPDVFRVPGTSSQESQLSPHHKHQIDVMLGSGMNAMDVSRRLSVSYGAVRWYAKQRTSV